MDIWLFLTKKEASYKMLQCVDKSSHSLSALRVGACECQIRSASTRPS